MIQIYEAYPLWMWLAFGIGGMTAFVLFVGLIWKLIDISKKVKVLRPSIKWFAIGFIVMFASKWVNCGVGYPGFVASSNQNFFDPWLAQSTAQITGAIGMTCSVIAWTCFIVGVNKLRKILSSDTD